MTYQDTITALADPRRRAIFDSLRPGPRSVAEIAAVHPITRPAVSQHLKILAEAGLVRAEAAGTRRIYEIRREGLLDLRRYLESFWQDALEAFADHVETLQKDD